MFFAQDNTGADKVIKQYELTSTWALNQHEIEVLMKMRHKNILPPSDVYAKGGFRYAVYEYSKSNNLQNFLAKKRELTEKEVLTISRQIIDAYKFIKDNGLIHGNIKPTNILVTDENELTIKLTDFLINSKRQDYLINDKYLPPEITSGKIKPNNITDLYYVGAIMKLFSTSIRSSNEIYLQLIDDRVDQNIG